MQAGNSQKGRGFRRWAEDHEKNTNQVWIWRRWDWITSSRYWALDPGSDDWSRHRHHGVSQSDLPNVKRTCREQVGCWAGQVRLTEVYFINNINGIFHWLHSESGKWLNISSDLIGHTFRWINRYFPAWTGRNMTISPHSHYLSFPFSALSFRLSLLYGSQILKIEIWRLKRRGAFTRGCRSH